MPSIRKPAACIFFHEFNGLRQCSLCRVFDAIIIVIKLRMGRRLLRQPQRLHDITRSELLQKDRIAQGAVFIQCLVDHIPGVYFTIVSRSHCGNMIHEILPDAVRIADMPHEGRQLTMPDKVVRVDPEMVFLCIDHQLISRIEAIGIPCGVDQLRLHAVLGRDRAKLLPDQRIRPCVRPPDLLHIQGCSDKEIIAIGFL